MEIRLTNNLQYLHFNCYFQSNTQLQIKARSLLQISSSYFKSFCAFKIWFLKSSIVHQHNIGHTAPKHCGKCNQMENNRTMKYVLTCNVNCWYVLVPLVTSYDRHCLARFPQYATSMMNWDCSDPHEKSTEGLVSKHK